MEALGLCSREFDVCKVSFVSFWPAGHGFGVGEVSNRC